MKKTKFLITSITVLLLAAATVSLCASCNPNEQGGNIVSPETLKEEIRKAEATLPAAVDETLDESLGGAVKVVLTQKEKQVYKYRDGNVIENEYGARTDATYNRSDKTFSRSDVVTDTSDSSKNSERNTVGLIEDGAYTVYDYNDADGKKTYEKFLAGGEYANKFLGKAYETARSILSEINGADVSTEGISASRETEDDGTVTLKLKYSGAKENYSVSFVYNGERIYTAKVLISIKETKTTYTYTADSETTLEFGYSDTPFTFNVYGGKVLYETVSPIIRITFNGVGSVEGVYGETIPYPEAPTKDGAEFGGYYTDEACTKKFERTVFPSVDVLLYPKWTEIGD